ncbi:hypothetical protein C7T94_11790 [Pedobacter yulinensis]|uniref:DUF4293 domain-containing protein n=1 Tax=Pedobacter yulinensis TaxID=2126353 RepID=A0A2T3HLE4_9SPHI|nr:hypothetical protein [Pedobacter yulinensis]PST83265.1 hypothetical protein C7T94_11790 [Pedobacter yulinensis]
MARKMLILGAAVLSFFGLLHFHDTFYSTDLHPADSTLIANMQVSHIRMGAEGNVWKLWLGFNAMFGAGLAFIGLANLYLFIRYTGYNGYARFLLLLTLFTNAVFLWIGLRLMVAAFAICMGATLLLFATGFTILELSRYRQQDQGSGPLAVRKLPNV